MRDLIVPNDEISFRMLPGVTDQYTPMPRLSLRLMWTEDRCISRVFEAIPVDGFG